MKKDEMPVLDHLAELRKRLAIIVGTIVLAVVVLFNFSSQIIDYLLHLNPGMQLVFITPSELLMVYVEITLICAIIITSPITIFQIWGFIQKGLHKNEKIHILASLFFGMVCFAVGVYFCYIVVLPITLEFFMRIAITEISAMISVESYTSFVNMMLLSFGIVFEMPVLVYLLTQLGVVNPNMLKNSRGVLIILIFIFAAFITPPDVVSQMLLGFPMIALLELSIFISSTVYKFKKKKERSIAKTNNIANTIN